MLSLICDEISQRDRFMLSASARSRLDSELPWLKTFAPLDDLEYAHISPADPSFLRRVPMWDPILRSGTAILMIDKHGRKLDCVPPSIRLSNARPFPHGSTPTLFEYGGRSAVESVSSSQMEDVAFFVELHYTPDGRSENPRFCVVYRVPREPSLNVVLGEFRREADERIRNLLKNLPGLKSPVQVTSSVEMDCLSSRTRWGTGVSMTGIMNPAILCVHPANMTPILLERQVDDKMLSREGPFFAWLLSEYGEFEFAIPCGYSVKHALAKPIAKGKEICPLFSDSGQATEVTANLLERRFRSLQGLSCRSDAFLFV